MAFLQHRVGMIGVVLAGFTLIVSGAFGQGPARPPGVEIPATATALEGLPTVRVDSAEGNTTRRVLGEADAASDRLTIRVVDGQFYWTSRGDRPLRLTSAGEFTYLASEPGKYIRFTRVNDKISYVEHVDTGFGSVTWWGELRIVLGNRD